MPTILVLDDDPDMRELLRRHLGAAGYDVLLATDADAARAVLETRKADLIVADIHMPGESGVEFVATLRDDARLAAIPVVYLTALEEDGELAVKTLGYPLIAKPLKASELLRVVRGQLPKGVVAAVDVERSAGN